jgi:general secretion pathway protein J
MRKIRSDNRDHLSAGFTLLEALLATVLMAVTLGILGTLTAQWLPNWDYGIVRMQRAQLLAAGLERLVEDLSAAEFVSDGSQNNVPVFDGNELSVTFVRTTLGPNATTGLEIVRIAEVRDERGLALVRRTAPFLPVSAGERQSEQREFSNPVVVLRAPYRISFSYAGTDRIWRDTWREAALLPRAVRVRASDANTSRTLAASTSTLIHAELPARCVAARLLLDQVQRTLGSNQSAEAAYLTDCLGPSANSFPGGISAGGGVGVLQMR